MDTPIQKMNAQELRSLSEKTQQPNFQRNSVIFILENIYDTYNVGGLFRLADALNIEKIILTGETETPPNHKIKKASVGTYKIVPWEYQKNTLLALKSLINTYKDISILAIEQSDRSIPYHTVSPQLINKKYLVFIVGNESFGINNETLKKCDYILEIPMFGVNKSLNVIVSMAIVTYQIILNTPAIRIKPKAIKE
jgi:tRNA G18 (ribose-2'-O)-methylase SpoU